MQPTNHSVTRERHGNPLSDLTYQRYREWMLAHSGVHLPAGKKPLIVQRLRLRLLARDMPSLDAYYQLLCRAEEQQERERAIDLLTTHETYFFREVAHFDWLHLWLKLQDTTRTQRFWCAAASSGEEVWSVAMILSEVMGVSGNWQLLGSDISTQVLAQAHAGHYPLQRCRAIPQAYLRRYCLKGQGRQQGTLLIAPALRQQVRFSAINLNQSLPQIGPFELVFMRNVLIYFNQQTKTEVILRVLDKLTAGGYLVVSHSESLHSLGLPLTLVAPGIYRKQT
jgi:chemotaxis protein methyltransferase CheR